MLLEGDIQSAKIPFAKGGPWGVDRLGKAHRFMYTPIHIYTAIELFEQCIHTLYDNLNNINVYWPDDTYKMHNWAVLTLYSPNFM